MIDIVRNSFAYCPRCDAKMMYFDMYSQMLYPDESGLHATAVLADKELILAVCPNCKTRYKMRRTVYGILPDRMAEEMHLGSKDPLYENSNPIGKEIGGYDITDFTNF